MASVENWKMEELEMLKSNCITQIDMINEKISKGDHSDKALLNRRIWGLQLGLVMADIAELHANPRAIVGLAAVQQSGEGREYGLSMPGVFALSGADRKRKKIEGVVFIFLHDGCARVHLDELEGVLEKLTVLQLKELLGHFSLRKGGKKDELVSKIMAHVKIHPSAALEIADALTASCDGSELFTNHALTAYRRSRSPQEVQSLTYVLMNTGESTPHSAMEYISAPLPSSMFRPIARYDEIEGESQTPFDRVGEAEGPTTFVGWTLPPPLALSTSHHTGNMRSSIIDIGPGGGAGRAGRDHSSSSSSNSSSSTSDGGITGGWPTRTIAFDACGDFSCLGPAGALLVNLPDVKCTSSMLTEQYHIKMIRPSRVPSEAPQPSEVAHHIVLLAKHPHMITLVSHDSLFASRLSLDPLPLGQETVCPVCGRATEVFAWDVHMSSSSSSSASSTAAGGGAGSGGGVLPVAMASSASPVLFRVLQLGLDVSNAFACGRILTGASPSVLPLPGRTMVHVCASGHIAITAIEARMAE